MFRRKAKWIYWRENDWDKQCKCSACKTSYGCMDTPYCPNCGRKMTGFKHSEELKSIKFNDKDYINFINYKLDEYYKQQKENKQFSEKSRALICRVIENCQKIVNDTYKEGE